MINNTSAILGVIADINRERTDRAMQLILSVYAVKYFNRTNTKTPTGA